MFTPEDLSVRMRAPLQLLFLLAMLPLPPETAEEAATAVTVAPVEQARPAVARAEPVKPED